MLVYLLFLVSGCFWCWVGVGVVGRNDLMEHKDILLFVCYLTFTFFELLQAVPTLLCSPSLTRILLSFVEILNELGKEKKHRDIKKYNSFNNALCLILVLYLVLDFSKYMKLSVYNCIRSGSLPLASPFSLSLFQKEHEIISERAWDNFIVSSILYDLGHLVVLVCICISVLFPYMYHIIWEMQIDFWHSHLLNKCLTNLIFSIKDFHFCVTKVYILCVFRLSL